jgi:antitoxin component YwqK of YwqJK toxin-antitoxin module
MRVTKTHFQIMAGCSTAMALAVVLAGLPARADDDTSLSSRMQTTQQANVAALPGTTAGADKTAADLSVPATEPAAGGAKIETITERYPNGSVKVERQVAQDAVGNYVNQGSYTMYDLDGKVVKAGKFQDGKQTGLWSQQLTKDEGHLFSAGQEKEFAGPFASEATFVDGQLNGTWTIKDAKGQKVIEWNFDHDIRHGTWTWWHPTGEKRLEATYRFGSLNGSLLEWDTTGKQVSDYTYVDGKCLVKTVGWYALGHKHFEGAYLRTQNVPAPTYDWWTSMSKAAPVAASGPDQKHGVWTEWYPSGTKKGEGQYDHDLPVGKFSYWYENGQVLAEGNYLAGSRTGTWISWHANGVKELQANYKDGDIVGKAMTWNADGKLVEVREDAVRPQPAKKPAQAQSTDVQRR